MGLIFVPVCFILSRSDADLIQLILILLVTVRVAEELSADQVIELALV
jgi:hypothetical protein